jgi:transposase InsO family protein
VYGDTFRRRLRGLGITEVRIAPHAPWQNPYVERLIGSLRRECLDHTIILGEAHLRRILIAYLRYYHEARPHLALARDAPVPRAVERPSGGRVVAVPLVGGLHHRYARAA